MSKDESAVKKVAEVKAYLEKRMAELGEEVSRLKSLLEVVDSILVERSFKRAAEAEVSRPAAPISQPTAPKEAAVETLPVKDAGKQFGAEIEQPKAAAAAAVPQPTVAEVGLQQVVPIKTVDGVHLADLQISSVELKVVPASNLKFNVNSPPLKAFLLSKVLEPMQAKDMEGMKAGSTPPDKVLSYKLEQEADLLKAIVIRNYGDEKRLIDLKNAVRWTLRRMYEKLSS